MKQKIAILGAGSWGTALAMVLKDNGHDVCLWGNNASQIEEINTNHTNHQYLPEVILNEEIYATTDLEKALSGANAVLFVLPTKVIRLVAKQVAPLLEGNPVIIHASKGLEQESYLRISEILKQELSEEKYEDIVVLSGPSHAEEVAKKDLTTITAACTELSSAKVVQQLFSNSYFRVYTNTDVIGVELGAALKNVIAVGAGALHGLGYGDNAKAALMTRGLAEISRLGIAFGADPLTFIGLSGVGDLIVTCTSIHSRNWRAGDQLGQGKSLDDILANMGMVVEGVETCKAAYKLAQEKGIEMPITNAVYNILYNGKNIKTEVLQLMERERKSEVSLKSHQEQMEVSQ